jgi:acetolactate synthase I/III small subunit
MSSAQPTSPKQEVAANKNLHTISLLVRDAPGVLVRVAMVFSRRGYNIESLVVSSAAKRGFSRMTVTCSGDSSILEQMIKQLAKLVDVVHATDHTTSDRFETEIALIKVRCEGNERRDVLEVAEHFNAKVGGPISPTGVGLAPTSGRAYPLTDSTTCSAGWG